jgi:hypothetical protein
MAVDDLKSLPLETAVTSVENGACQHVSSLWTILERWSLKALIANLVLLIGPADMLMENGMVP